MPPGFDYTFPSIRGVQAGRDYYVSMCPLRLVTRIFEFDGTDFPPEVRAQRVLDKRKVQALTQYFSMKPSNHVFPAVTVSVDAEVTFKPFADARELNRIGTLRIPLEARFVINDGQNRIAAVRAALNENPDLGNEAIPVVFFIDLGLERCEQLFADLNRSGNPHPRSLNVLYDPDDQIALLTKRVVTESPLFQGLVEMDKTTLAPRSGKLFTLSKLYLANKALVAGWELVDQAQAVQRAISFWECIADQLSEWGQVQCREITAGTVRRDFIHTHGIVLQALGHVGNALLKRSPEGWQNKLASLGKMDWSRANAATWEGRAIVDGRVSKSRRNIVLTRNFVKQAFGLKLSSEEEKIESAFLRSDHSR